MEEPAEDIEVSSSGCEETFQKIVKINLVKADTNISFDNFDNICRVCFATTNLRSLHEMLDEDVISPAEILLQFGISIYENENFPQNICDNCTEKLFELYLVMDFCRQSENSLKEVYETSQNNVEEHNYCETSRITYVEDSESEKNTSKKKKKSIDAKPKDGVTPDVITVVEINYEDGCDYGEVLQKFELDANDPLLEDYETIKIEYEPEIEETQNENKRDKDGVYACEFCATTFSNASNFARHRYVHLGDKPHKCCVCDKSYTRKESLNIHMKYHTGENHHVCKYCEKQFTTKANYNRHVLQHKLENGELENDVAQAVLETITCRTCNKKFSSKHCLRTHMLVHQPKLYSCEQCGKKFTFQGNLKNHLRTHTGEKPYQCEHCEKSFSFKSSLKEHVYTHTGEKPHVCQYCNKGFAQNQQLKTHLRTHTGERPYACHYCGKTFANKVNMTVHERIHTGHTPYICTVCDKGFYDSSSLKKHKKRHEDSVAIIEDVDSQMRICK